MNSLSLFSLTEFISSLCLFLLGFFRGLIRALVPFVTTLQLSHKEEQRNGRQRHNYRKWNEAVCCVSVLCCFVLFQWQRSEARIERRQQRRATRTQHSFRLPFVRFSFNCSFMRFMLHFLHYNRMKQLTV